MKPRFIICNWKMNPETESQALGLFSSTVDVAKSVSGVTVVIAPPFPFLSVLSRQLNAETGNKKFVAIAAQDVFWEKAGAYTGEISSSMEKNLGVTYVIVGHSERRRFLDETDEMIARKVKQAIDSGMTPVLCVGEAKRDGNQIPESVASQVRLGLSLIDKDSFSRLLIAYEPVWAIGSGTPDTPQGMLQAAIFIRGALAELSGDAIAKNVSILYGGSVTSANVEGFFNETKGEVQGVLVGGASLKPEEISAIITKTADLAIRE